MATSLSIKGKTQGNDAVTSTINYVNPNATDAQLVSLATAMNNLTTNTVADITRIDKNSLINTVTKLPRNLTAETTSIAWSDISTTTASPSFLLFSGDGFDDTTTYAYIDNINHHADRVEGKGNLYALLIIGQSVGGIVGLVRDTEGTAPTNSTIKVIMPETEQYQAATLTFTIT